MSEKINLDSKPKKESLNINQSARYKKIGKSLIKYPIILLLASILVWLVITFLFPIWATPNPQPSTYEIVLSTIHWFLGILALIGLIGIVIGVPWGIYYLRKAKKVTKGYEKPGKGKS